jgi:hypothetical protein
MGCFSFVCKESGLPVASDSFSGDAVRMYLLEGGNVIEEMRGHYDSYGRVFKDSTYDDSFEWSLEWGKVCDLMFTDNEGDGEQGWGPKNGGRVKIKEPIHIVY